MNFGVDTDFGEQVNGHRVNPGPSRHTGKNPTFLHARVDNWDDLSAYFQYSEPIRRMIYTTNTVEGFNRHIRKITKSKGGFGNDESLFKLVFLIYQDLSKKWVKPIPNWGEIISQLFIHFSERLEGRIR